LRERVYPKNVKIGFASTHFALIVRAKFVAGKQNFHARNRQLKCVV